MLKKCIFLIFFSMFLLVGCENKANEDKAYLNGKVPYTIDDNNYIITVNSIEQYEDYTLFDYNMEAKEGFSLEKDKYGIWPVNITGHTEFDGDVFGFTPVKIVDDFNGSTRHVIEGDYIIGKNGELGDIRYKFSIANNGAFQDKFLETKDKFKYTIKNDKNYIELNKKVRFDNVDFVIRSIGNFEFGTIVSMYSTNLSKEESKKIEDENLYSLEVKSKDFNKKYPLEILIGCSKEQLDEYGYDSDFVTFFVTPLRYSKNEIDGNIEIYLVNNKTGEKLEIYNN
ncbi:hypothetical protein ACV30B_16240 [Clostridium perfringens]|nr:hypothetical protein [Clostridium perfringens]ATD50111.1 hypothetical protein CMR01_15290 [Clostridium perfringens]MBO3329845.1 hypothetical protein [Clostridium perfringens]MBO3411986.1 hypothetical protein [Clostridium perfringens]MBO3427874.1 hypothetical protein [Clostridium perfringens]MBO3434113.1 hypothetical protein [Clostridium perfringens]